MTEFATIVEVILLAAIYYGFIRHLQKTRGGGLLAGFIVVLIVAVVVFAAMLRNFDFPHLDWIADTALPALGFALLIIFQPELRLAMARIGAITPLRVLQRFFGSDSPQNQKVVDAIISACGRMSKAHIGALIVVKRREGIEGFAVGGARIDAEVSARLLETVFYPGTSLHDGALMIMDGRIMFAGCKLPVSASNALVKQFRLGTRHSAALGLSEESDALVIVVSEETGRISTARHGQMRIGLSLDELRMELTEGLGAAVAGGDSSSTEALEDTKVEQKTVKIQTQRFADSESEATPGVGM